MADIQNIHIIKYGIVTNYKSNFSAAYHVKTKYVRIMFLTIGMYRWLNSINSTNDKKKNIEEGSNLVTNDRHNKGIEIMILIKRGEFFNNFFNKN